MITLSVTAGNRGKEYLGKPARELQSGIVVYEKKAITGTLNYVTGYREFNPGNVDEQSGNYLVLNLSSEDGEIQTKVTGEGGGDTFVTVDDGFCVYRLKSNKQKIEIKVTKNGHSMTEIYDLSGLTFKEA